MTLRRPSHTTVIAYLALFVALSGTAIAAKKIGPDGLKKAAVTTKKVADGAITTGKLKDGAVTEPKLGNNAVTGSKLAANSVGTNKLKDDAVESAQLANGSVVEAKIGNDAVTSSKVAPGALGLDDIANVVAAISYDPGVIVGTGSCSVSDPIAVAGLQGNDSVLVIPLGTDGGWTADFMLASYGLAGPGTVRVEVCNQGAPVDPPALPMLALAFR